MLARCSPSGGQCAGSTLEQRLWKMVGVSLVCSRTLHPLQAKELNLCPLKTHFYFTQQGDLSVSVWSFFLTPQ